MFGLGWKRGEEFGCIIDAAPVVCNLSWFVIGVREIVLEAKDREGYGLWLSH